MQTIDKKFIQIYMKNQRYTKILQAKSVILNKIMERVSFVGTFLKHRG
jgi:predicted nucleic-acid-binding Zn-ribbon protein